MRKIFFLIVIFLLSPFIGKTQFFDGYNPDSTRVYLSIEWKESARYPFSKRVPCNFFNDSASFYQFLDTMSIGEKPKVDFKMYQVRSDIYCKQCLTTCFHNGTYHRECHRNVCSYTTELFLQQRKIREEINFEIILSPPKSFYKDSIISTQEKWKSLYKEKEGVAEIDFEKNLVLHQYAGGDCHARFSHEAFLDHTNKRLVWRIYNEYGGCRAGLSKEFVIKVQQPPSGYEIKFEEILVD